MEYYIEMYKIIVSMIDNANKDIVSNKKDILKYQGEIDLYDSEISDRRDDIVYQIECLEEKEEIYNFKFNALQRYKKEIRSNIYFILFSSLFLLLRLHFFSESVISNMCLVCFLAISIPCGLNTICKYIKSLVVKKTLSKFDVSSNKKRINFLKKKLNDIDISLENIYNDRYVANQRIEDLNLEIKNKKMDIRNYNEEKRKLEKDILEYIGEVANFSCNKDLDGQIYIDDVFKKIRKI